MWGRLLVVTLTTGALLVVCPAGRPIDQAQAGQPGPSVIAALMAEMGSGQSVMVPRTMGPAVASPAQLLPELPSASVLGPAASMPQEFPLSLEIAAKSVVAVPQSQPGSAGVSGGLPSGSVSQATVETNSVVVAAPAVEVVARDQMSRRADMVVSQEEESRGAVQVAVEFSPEIELSVAELAGGHPPALSHRGGVSAIARNNDGRAVSAVARPSVGPGTGPVGTGLPVSSPQNHGEIVSAVAQNNHGQAVSAVARSSAGQGSSTQNHGQIVSAVARNNHGHQVSAVARSSAGQGSSTQNHGQIVSAVARNNHGQAVARAAHGASGPPAILPPTASSPTSAVSSPGSFL